MQKSELKYSEENGVISYPLARKIKIFDVKKSDNVAYLIKTLLEIINRWGDIEVHVLTIKKESGEDVK